jgi:hypothetical protein
MTTDNSIPDATEVKRLRDRYDASWKVAAVYFDAYNTAKATREAASDTGRILDEAEAARQTALDAYSVTWATHDRANKARVVAKREHDVARVAYNDSCAAVVAARKAHEATR